MNRKQRQYGAATIEAAFLLPVLIAFILIFFEVGRIQFHIARVEHAIQAAKRDTQLEQGVSLGQLATVFQDKFIHYGGMYSENAKIDSQQYHSVNGWLGHDEGAPSTSDHGLVTLDLSVTFQPLAIPFFTLVPDQYVYRTSMILIPELINEI